MLEEEQLNGRIASVIRPLTAGMDWTVREELWNALRGPKTKPDILITRPDAPPIVLENEFHPADTVLEDCMKSIGRDLNPPVANASGVVNTLIAIRSPSTLKQCADGDEAYLLLENGATLEYAVYQGTRDKHTRFPEAGFISGDVRNLVEFIKPAAEAQDFIDEATKVLEQGTEDAAYMLMACPSKTCVDIGAELRQPYPMSSISNTQKEEKEGQIQREQTAKMAAAIMINALAYQQNLAGHRDIKSLANVRNGTKLTQDAVIAEWDNILRINYWPIFYIAKRLLQTIPPVPAANLLERMAQTANLIEVAIRTNDVAGTVFQRLITDRQTLATYYTRPESTTLAAHLAIPEDRDWGSPETLKNYHIADYACGTGGLVLAAYQRARELHRNHGGNPDALHGYMMENALTACDIMPAAVHLTASLLSSVAPKELYDKTRSVLYGYGGTGELDNKGNPVVNVGSLELLDLKNTTKQAVLPLSEQVAMGATGEQSAIDVDMSPLSQDLVIMNPPFTAPTNHEGKDKHSDTVNPAFAAFQTSDAEQTAMSQRTKQLSKGTIGDGNAGLGAYFAAIAHNMVKPNGHIALILPISSMLGGNWDGKQEWSWQKLRRLLSENYNDIIILSIAQNETVDSSFSADTDLAEAMIIARRLAVGESPARLAHFVNLKGRPRNRLEAQETARSIREVIKSLTAPDTHAIAAVGENDAATVRLERVSPREKRTTARIVNIGLVRTAKAMANGSLYLPQRSGPVAIPMTNMGQLGRVGPLHRDVIERGPFTKRTGASSATEWPMLWNHDKPGKRVQVRMETPPDSSGSVMTGKETAAAELWSRASHLHVNMDFRFNANSTAAAFTKMRSLGGREWPNLQMDTPEMEKATCVWLNGILGMIAYWMNSNRTQTGRGGTTITAMPSIATLDVRQLTDEQMQAAVQIYDDLCQKEMLPANEAYQDPVRQELDRRLITAVLGLDGEAVDQLEILRNQWCMEPTVAGTKKTGLAA